MSDDVPPFYAMLEVDTDADREEITGQYRKLVKEYHPDQGGTDKEFKKLQSAKETLTSATKRRRYDRVGHTSYVEITRCSGWHTSPTAGQSESTNSGRSTQAQSERKKTNHGNNDQRDNTSKSDDRSSESTTNGGQTRDGRRNDSSSSTGGSHQYTSQSHSTRSGSRNRRSSTNKNSRRSNQSTDFGDHTRSSSMGWTGPSSWRSYSVTGDWSSAPRLLMALVFSVGLSAILASVANGQSTITAGIAVLVGSGVVYGRDIWVTRTRSTTSGPQLLTESAVLITTICGVGTLLLLIAVARGSLNGGLLLGRFVGGFVLLLMVVIGVMASVVVGVLTRSVLAGSITGGIVAILFYVIEFTPLRWWFPFGAITDEPASTIAPWFAVGPPTGYTLGWAVNMTLGMLLFISVILGLFFLVVGFTNLLRDGSRPDIHTTVWELFAATPILGLTWWSLSGNTIWALHGNPPASISAAIVVLSVCAWPTVVFGSYAVVSRLFYS